MFDIRFTDEPPEVLEEGGLALRGRISLGDDSDGFLAPLVPWSRADYEGQWTEAAARLLAGSPTSAFVTVAWHSWWPAWREGDHVLFNEQLYGLAWEEARRPVPDVHHTPCDLVAAHRVDIRGGHRISTWRVAIADIADFAKRGRAGTAS